MEPALDERGDASLRLRAEAAFQPQWSPLSTSGATGSRPNPSTRRRCRNGARSRRAGRHVHLRAHGRRCGGAAMEPALDERGDLASAFARSFSVRAAMEPALDERGDLGRRVGAAVAALAAAMEPALDERGDLLLLRHLGGGVVPQWSPLSTSGATP